jgi:hypothetical protein
MPKKDDPRCKPNAYITDAGGTTTPTDGQTYSALTITNNAVTVPISGYTRVLRITP